MWRDWSGIRLSIIREFVPQEGLEHQGAVSERAVTVDEFFSNYINHLRRFTVGFVSGCVCVGLSGNEFP